MSAALSLNRNGSINGANGSIAITQAGTDYVVESQNIGIVTEVLDTGDVGTIGYVFIKNLDPTNYIEVGINTPVTQIFARLKPGEFTVFPAQPGATYYAKANIAPCDVQLVVLEA